MRTTDYLRMGLKNLARQRARTFLTITAITVGSFSLILMTALLLNIRQSLLDKFQKLGAFDLVTVIKDPNSTNSNSLIGGNGDMSSGKMIDDATLAQVRLLPNVKRVTPVIGGIGFKTMRLEGQDRKTWASVTAYDPGNDVFDLPIAAGRNLTSTDMDKIIVGTRFMQDINYRGKPDGLVGKKVLLNYQMGGGMAPDWGPLPEKPPLNADRAWYESRGNIGEEIPAEIVGVSDGGSIDDGQSYITIGWARRLLVNVSWQSDNDKNDNKNGQNTKQSFAPPVQTLVKEDSFTRQGYSSLVIKADSTDAIAKVAEAVKTLGYGATTAQTMVDQINQIMTMVGLVLAAIGGISLFVASIGIVNTMVMATYERIREIGVMRACGATRAVIRRLFTFEAALLGFWGGVCGLLLSMALAKIAKQLIEKYGTSLSSLPLDQLGHFPLWLIFAAVGFATLLGALSGLYPAIRASRLNPVEALRYE